LLIIQVLFLQRIIRKKGGDAEKMSEINNNSTEKIDENSEKITSETEKIPEIIRYRGQRGPDKTPRRFNANSRSNLKQYQNIPEPKSNSDKWIWIVIGIVIVLAITFVIWKIYQRKKNKQSL